MGITILAVLAANRRILRIPDRWPRSAWAASWQASTGSAALFGFAAIFGVVALVTGIASLAFAYGADQAMGMASRGRVGHHQHRPVGRDDRGRRVISPVRSSPTRIQAVILYYLFQPTIKSLFGRA